MKTLSTYITEKLKLSDINRTSLDGGWTDSSKFKLQDLEEGDIIMTKEPVFNNKYIVITCDLFDDLSHSRIRRGQQRLFICNDNIPNHYTYLLPKYYTDNLKDMDGNTEYDIIKVYKRPKKYTDINELKHDLKNIDKF